MTSYQAWSPDDAPPGHVRLLGLPTLSLVGKVPMGFQHVYASGGDTVPVGTEVLSFRLLESRGAVLVEVGGFGHKGQQRDSGVSVTEFHPYGGGRESGMFSELPEPANLVPYAPHHSQAPIGSPASLGP